MPKIKKTIPIYEYEKKVNGQTRYYIRPYIDGKQVTKRLDDDGNMWLGRDGYNRALEYLFKGDISHVVKEKQIAELFEEYINFKKGEVKVRTIKTYVDTFRNYIKPYFEEKYISKITPLEIEQWHKALNEKNFSIRLRRDIHSTFARLFDYAKKIYKINNDALVLVGNFKKKRGEITEKELLREEEFLYALKFEKDRLYRNFFKVLFYTGMRIGEICALKVKDIDLERNLIDVSTTVWQHAKDVADTITAVKTDCSNRRIPMLREIRSVLEELVKDRDGEEFLFGGERYLPEENIRRHLRNMLNQAEIFKKITPHSLRHSFITMCALKGVDVRITSKIVGHADINTTYKIYTHVYENETLQFDALFHEKTLTRSEQDQRVIWAQ